MNKKIVILTSLITASAVFFITTMFYLTPMGALVFGKFSDSFTGASYSRFIRMENLIRDNYMGKYSPGYLMDRALHTYVESIGDPYTTYLNTREYESLQSNLDGEYRGIGITVSAKDGQIHIAEVNENSPAQKAGIEKGDILTEVNGVSYNAATLSEAVSAIKNVKQGESVDIGVLREGASLHLTVHVEKIQIINVSGKILEPGVGYIRIKTFGNKIDKEFSDIIDSLESEGMQGLIIDLRSNPGGALESAVKVTDILVGKGNILTVRDKSGNEDIYTSDENELKMPICVLINEESASASEVLSGALRDYDKATLIGKKTFGKGVVQSVYGFGDGTGLRLTTAKYFTPSGECIHEVGINPDIEVDLPEGVVYSDTDMKSEDDTQLEVAIEEIKKQITK